VANIWLAEIGTCSHRLVHPKRTVIEEIDRHIQRWPPGPFSYRLAGGTRFFENSCSGRPRKRIVLEDRMIRKLSSGEYRLYSRKINPKTGKRRNLGTFKSRAAAEKHERDVQYFKRH
jgi:hypothetical protein